MFSFRTQPKPSVRRFLAASALWTALTLCALLTLSFCLSLKNGYGWYSAWHQSWSELFTFWTDALPLCIACGFLLGGIHYLLARAFCRKKKQPVRFSEIGFILCAVAVLFGYQGYRFIEGQISQACWQYEVEMEIQSLVAQGNYSQAVRRMEESCKIYQDALKKGIPDKMQSLILRSGANGMGYFYCTLVNGWETLALNMPLGLRSYLDGGPTFSSGSEQNGLLDDAEQWKPLGTEMAASKTPIIRVLGYWLLEDSEQFAAEVYSQYDSGDQSFRALNDLVCFQYDPDPKRAIHRLLSFKPRTHLPQGNLRFFEEEDRMGRIYHLTLTIVKTGDEIGDDMEAVRPILLQFSQTPDFKESNYNRWFSTDLFENLQSHIENGDMDSALRLMEIACHNLHDSRTKLGEDFTLLARGDKFPQYQGFFAPLSEAKETFELNIPISLVWFISHKTHNVHESYFNKSYPDAHQYRTYGKASLFEEPNKMLRLAVKMTESSTPILRALGYYLKEDRPNFISTVYQTHDSGDSSFASLHQLVSEKMDNR